MGRSCACCAGWLALLQQHGAQRASCLRDCKTACTCAPPPAQLTPIAAFSCPQHQPRQVHRGRHHHQQGRPHHQLASQHAAFIGRVRVAQQVNSACTRAALFAPYTCRLAHGYRSTRGSEDARVRAAGGGNTAHGMHSFVHQRQQNWHGMRWAVLDATAADRPPWGSLRKDSDAAL